MSSGDDVRRLRREGLSIRRIAAQLGLSRMRVHRLLSGFVEWDSPNDDDPEGDQITPPLVFCGMSDPDPQFRDVTPRFMDAAGRYVNGLDLYRWRFHQAGDGRDAERAAVEADVDAQIAAAGWVQVNGGDGYWHWDQTCR